VTRVKKPAYQIDERGTPVALINTVKTNWAVPPTSLTPMASGTNGRLVLTAVVKERVIIKMPLAPHDACRVDRTVATATG
jgi:hypothetical protein